MYLKVYLLNLIELAKFSHRLETLNNHMRQITKNFLLTEVSINVKCSTWPVGMTAVVVSDTEAMNIIY